MKTVFSLVFLVVAGWLPGQAPRLVVPIGHTDLITSIAISPDGKYILTGSYDQTAKLWDLNGREIQTFTGYEYIVSSVAFSPDGTRVLIGSLDGTISLMNLKGHKIQSYPKQNRGVTSVVFSPDGKMILTGSWDSTAKLWDLTGNLVQSFSGHMDNVTSVAFSPDGKMILTGSFDTTAKLWNLKGQIIKTFAGHSSYVNAVAFSPNGKMVLTGGIGNEVNLWNLNGSKIKTFLTGQSSIKSVDFSPDGKMVLAGGELLDLEGHEIKTFSHGGYSITSIAFSPDGKMVLTAGGRTAKSWDLSGRKVNTFTGHASPVTSVTFSYGGVKLLICRDNKAVQMWDVIGHEIHSLPGYGYNVATFSPDGKTILTGSADKTAKLWDLDGRQIQTYIGHMASVGAVAFSPDGGKVLTGSDDNKAKLWNLNGQEIQTFSGHTDSPDGYPTHVRTVAFCPDGRQVMTGSDDYSAKLWKLDGREDKTFAHDGFGVSSVAISPDGRMGLTGSWDNTAILWDLNGDKIQTFSGHTEGVTSVAFTPDEKMVLTGSWDSTAKLWDLKGHEIQTFSGHTDRIYSVDVSPNGKMALTGSGDNTTKIWDIETGRELGTLISIDSIDWVITTSSGLFDASPGAMKLMHYVQDLDVIELEQLKERYYEPGLLAKVMGFDKNELRNVAAFDQVALYPEIKATVEKGQLHIQLTERNGGLGKLSFFLNGKEVQEDLNPQRLKNLNIDLKNYTKYYQTDTINTLALRAYNAEGWLKSQAYELQYKPTATLVGKTIPHLYAIVVGTSNYAGDRLDLRFADLDAEAIAKALQSTSGALFGTEHTSVQLLSTSAAAEISSKNNIRQAFSRIATKSTPADVLVVYFSGHGIAYGDAEKAQFYYLTKDIGSEDLSDPEVRSKYAISSDTLTKWLTDIPAKKQVMILDACNAGKVLETLATLDKKELDPSQVRAFDRMKDRTGMFILTGSAADQVSYEASQYGQGLLTYSLLQGMSGLALKEGKYVDVNTLFQYSCDQVPLLAQGIGGVQKPILASPGGASFDIGITQPGAISLAQVKPVFIRNVFQEETSFDDVLGLTDALEALFQRITAKGARAEVIFVDVKEYGAAYSMKGRYTITGDAVEVRVRLFKGKTPVGEELKVRGSKDAVGALAEGILGKVLGMIK